MTSCRECHIRGRKLGAGIGLRLALVLIATVLTFSVAVANAQDAINPGAMAGPTSTVSSARAALGTAGGATASSTLSAVPEDFSKLKIEPGFLLDMQVYGESDMSRQLRVGADGNVLIPLAGAIHVAGDTLAESEKEIENKLISAEVLKRPQVTLNILQYAPTMVTVFGEVNTPGRLQMLAPHSLLDVLSLAGGETQLAGDEIKVRQKEQGKVIVRSYHYARDSSGEAISDVMVHDGDTVIVPRTGIVYVLGAVNRPGGYPMQEDGKLDVAQALSLAMGTTLVAKTSHMTIIRRREDGTFIEFPVNYQAIVKGKMTPPVLHAQDIVYVPVNRTEAVLNGSLGIISGATQATIYAVH